MQLTFSTRIPPVTSALLLLMALTLPLNALLLPAGAGCNSCTLQGEGWRLFTSLFLHADLQHLLSNASCLLMLGFFLEKQLTPWTFSLLFFLSGLAGNVLTLLLMPAHFTHVGASGAVFGLLGAQIYIFYLQKQRYGHREFSLLLLALLLLVSATFLDRTVNIAAHLGGLLAGGMLMPLLYKE
ncbi:rhomboid family intramembrane serine protease [Ectobacillus ponti]|uniref:Rhomboid family intramembrane serine protease n=1 Tax=Ectobacillus ponti TaxID=2961894 RepID=A0AA41X9F7_9BACI|nr:rhomboid family intramembrane serine protease [Ectobacillus ponti]MCP8971252.1 rhomboid family intramembrane serine protease [Ectobacillus ponti]